MSRTYDPKARHEEYARSKARLDAMRRLNLLVDYDGPTTAIGLPKALGDVILQRWRGEPDHPGWERLAEALQLSPTTLEKDLKHVLNDDKDSPISHLERRTLYLLSLGFVPKQIAQFDEVGPEAVKERLRRARSKLGANSSLHAVAIAIRRELLW